MPLWDNIAPHLKHNQKFIITSHVNPDCDALGSELALAEFLHNQNKQVSIINSDGVPDNYRFLDPHRMIEQYQVEKHQAVIDKAEVVIVLDASGGWQRIGPVGTALAQSNALKLCIDHHPDAIDFVDVAVVDTDAAATAELIYDLLIDHGVILSTTMATALYAGVITDTGNFRFPKTSAHTHQVAAALVSNGADPLGTYRKIYEQNPLRRVRLKGHVMNLIKTTSAGQIAYYALDLNTLKAYKVQTSELDGFASMGQTVGGVRIVVFCAESSRSKIKISLRSDGTCPINKLAAEYGGGGHPSAAGATVSGEALYDVLSEVVEKAEQLLEEYPLPD